MAKKIHSPLFIGISLFLSGVIGIIGTIALYYLGAILAIRYGGLPFIGGGDESPFTYSAALAAFVGSCLFPSIIWLLQSTKGALKTASIRLKIITFIIIGFIPLWIYQGFLGYEELKQVWYRYDHTHGVCINKNGTNERLLNNNKEVIECKKGARHGTTKTYNANGTLIKVETYENGVKSGPETTYYTSGNIRSTREYQNNHETGDSIIFNENGSVTNFTKRQSEKIQNIYTQVVESYFQSELSQESQKYYCSHQMDFPSEYYSYTCKNGAIDGEFIKKDREGKLMLRIQLSNGKLNGAYDRYYMGKLSRHLEFKNEVLHGKVVEYFEESGKVEYEGQYQDGLQEGIFRTYEYTGKLKSEVVFEHGKIISYQYHQ